MLITNRSNLGLIALPFLVLLDRRRMDLKSQVTLSTSREVISVVVPRMAVEEVVGRTVDVVEGRVAMGAAGLEMCRLLHLGP